MQYELRQLENTHYRSGSDLDHYEDGCYDLTVARRYRCVGSERCQEVARATVAVLRFGCESVRFVDFETD